MSASPLRRNLSASCDRQLSDKNRDAIENVAVLRRVVVPLAEFAAHFVPPGPERQAIRSETPAGFARAFFEANP